MLLIYFIILILCSVYQDFYLVNIFGEIARSPIFLFLPIFIFTELYQILIKRNEIITYIQRTLLFYIIAVSFVGATYVLYLIFKGHYYFLDENIFLKFIKGQLYLIIIWLYLRHSYLILNKLTKKQIFYAMISVLSILNIVLIIEYFSLPNALEFLHSQKIPYYRIRLLTVESSWTGSIYVVLCALSWYYMKSYMRMKTIYIKLYIGISFISYVMLTQSKGFFVALLISIMIFSTSLIKKKKLSRKTLFFLITLSFLFIFAVFFFIQVFLPAFGSDIENYTSMSTRLGVLIAALKVIIVNPLGVGTGAYIIFLANGIVDVVPFLKQIFSFLFNSTPNLSELFRITNSTIGLSVKSGIFQWILEGGILAIVLFLSWSKYILHITKESNMLKMAVIFIAVASLTYISINIKYEIWLLISCIEFSKKQSSKS